MANGQNFFDQTIKEEEKHMITFKKLQLVKEMIIQLVVYQIIVIYNMIPIDLSKRKALDGDPKANQQINFIGNLERDGSIAFFFFFLSLLKKQNKIFQIFQKEL